MNNFEYGTYTQHKHSCTEHHADFYEFKDQLHPRYFKMYSQYQSEIYAEKKYGTQNIVNKHYMLQNLLKKVNDVL